MPTPQQPVTAPEAEQQPATKPQVTEPAPPEPLPPIHLLAEKEVRRLSRRELLKLSPLVLAGAFAIPKLRDYLLQAGVAASDWASDATFRRAHPVATYPDSLVVPFDKFPYNGYDVIDPGVDLENWTLTVEGQVANPGEYSLAQVQKPSQDRGEHAARLRGRVGRDRQLRRRARFRFPEGSRRRYAARVIWKSSAPTTTTNPSTWPACCIRSRCSATKCTASRWTAATALRCACSLPTKLGYKQAKYLTTLRVTNVLPARQARLLGRPGLCLVRGL